MFKESDVSWARIIAEPCKYVQGKHNGYHCMYHTVHELTNNSTIWMLLAISLFFLCNRAVSFGQGRSVHREWDVLVSVAGDVSFFYYRCYHSFLIHIIN